MGFYLGVFGFGPNPAAAIVQDGKIVAFAEEERFNRIKMAPTSLPIASILYCLKTAGLNIEQIDALGFAWNSPDYIATAPDIFAKTRAQFDISSDDYNTLYENSLIWAFHPSRIRTELCQALALKGQYLRPDRIKFLRHHLCHAASAYFPANLEGASILTIDGSGEQFATVLWSGSGSSIKEIESITLPNTLGGYYASFTEYLGFKAYEEEGKLMGLAPYGAYSEDMQRRLDEVIPFDAKSGSYQVNPRMRYAGRRSYGRRFTDDLVELFGSPRLQGDTISDRHKAIAFNVQHRLELIVAAIVRRLIKKTGSTNLCLSGGVAMNCKMNGKLAELPEVERIFVQPASSDNGVALGAAYLLAQRAGVNRFAPMTHAYWGPEYNEDEIVEAVRESKLPFRRSGNIIEEAACFIRDGLIVAWFQGRMEVGARALGGRSILANPLMPDMRRRLNLEVKHREDWRPFCPSLPIEAYDRYFDNDHNCNFMILAFPVRQEVQHLIPAVVHVDGTARPQTVSRESNPRFHALLEEFGRLTGHPVLLNTSFNIQGEPIVCTPTQALRCFGGTGIDVLVMGDFMVLKPEALRRYPHLEKTIDFSNVSPDELIDDRRAAAI
jgi:carbamoyltransferase